MIELTEQQQEGLRKGQPIRLRDPRTNQTYVLMRAEDFDRLKESFYDDSPWTDEERDALAWEAGGTAGWDEMDEYNHYGEG